MAQSSKKFQTFVQTTVNGAGWTAVVCPFSECRHIVIRNVDAVSDLQLSTDASDPTSIETIAAGTEARIDLSPCYPKGFVPGDVVCYLKGSGDKPIVRFAV